MGEDSSAALHQDRDAKSFDDQLGERDPALRARLGDVLAAAEGKSQTKLVDIRSADKYSGKIFAPGGSKELAVRAGHAPGAINVPRAKTVTEDGRLKPTDELRKLYADVGIDGSKPVITYRQIGEFITAQLCHPNLPRLEA